MLEYNNNIKIIDIIDIKFYKSIQLKFNMNEYNNNNNKLNNINSYILQLI